MSLFFSALFLCVSVFSTVKMDVRADGAWNTGPQGLKDGYQYVRWTDKNNDKFRIEGKQVVTGVYQGINNTTFALDAPIATIFIDEKKVDKVASRQNNMVQSSSNPHVWENETLKIEEFWETETVNANELQKFFRIDYNKTAKDNGFGDFGFNYLMFDQEAAAKADQVNHRGLLVGADNFFDGRIVEYTFKGAAEYKGKKVDVVITYSDLHIVLQNNIDQGAPKAPYSTKYNELKQFLICSGNDVRTHANARDTKGNQRYGIKVNALVQVKDGTTVEDGIFYFKSADIDVSREGTSFSNLFDAGNNLDYSEQIQINSGIPDAESYKLYLPGGTADVDESEAGLGNQNRLAPGNSKLSKTLPGYKSIIKLEDGKYRIEPQKTEVKDHQNSIYSGFLTAIDNTDGANVTVWSSGAGKDNNGDNVSVETYLLAGNAGGKTTGTWYNLKSSTETIGGPYPYTGGNIYTTNWGNKNGTPFNLGRGEKTLEPTTLTVSGGKTITYTLIPEADKGYVLKQLIASDGTIIYDASGTDDVPIVGASSGNHDLRSNPNLNDNQTEELSYTVSNDTHPVTGEPLSYTFTFKNIQQNHAIHVVWQKKYYETYEFQLEGDPSYSLPSDVTDLLPERATAGKEKRFWVNETIAPASPWDHVNNVPKDEVIVTDGATKYKYSFLRYEDNYSPSYTYTDYNHGSGEYYTTGASGAPAPRSTVRQNIHFTGYWKKTPAYKESYSYNEYLDENNNPILAGDVPQSVKETIPLRAEWYADGETVIPANPSATEVPDGSNKYVFRGWDKDFATVNGADVAFAGKWKRVAATTQTFTETYDYELQGVGTIPPEVWATLPHRAYRYFDNEKVSAANPVSALEPKKLRVTVNGVTYVFIGWESDTAVVDGGNVNFVGIWKVLSDPQPQPQPQPDPDPDPDPQPQPGPDPQPQPDPDPQPQPQPDPAPTPAPQPEPAPAPAATPVNVTVDPPLGAVPYADVNLTQVNAPQTGTDLQILPELLLLTTSVGGVIRFRKKRKR